MKLKLFNQLLEEIETYLEKDSKNGPIGGANQQHTDIGSITGNKCQYMNNKCSTDIGSITGNQAKFSQPYKQITQQQADGGACCCTGGEGAASSIGDCGGNAAITTGSVMGPTTPADSQANFTTACQKSCPKHQASSGINHSDIRLLLTPALPYKKLKTSKKLRKYPLLSRFK